MTSHSSYSDSSRLTEAAENAARYGSRRAHYGMERAADDLDEARAHGGEALRHLAHSTEDLAHRGMDAVRDSADHLRERSLQVRDSTAHYIQDEPMKSVLIAAAVGAALMGLVAVFSRTRSSPSYSSGYRNR